jgi:hypothetical protein
MFAEKLIVVRLVNKLHVFLWAPTIFNCVTWSVTGPYLEEIKCSVLYQIISFKIYFNIRPPLTPKFSLFFKFYGSSFVLTDLLLAAFYIVTFYDVTVNFIMPQFALDAISRMYKLSRPNMHTIRLNKLRRPCIETVFSADGVRVVPSLSPHVSARFVTVELYLFRMRVLVYKLYVYAFSSVDVWI